MDPCDDAGNFLSSDGSLDDADGKGCSVFAQNHAVESVRGMVLTFDHNVSFRQPSSVELLNPLTDYFQGFQYELAIVLSHHIIHGLHHRHIAT